ncbi:uncharacterized protein METZ01_LOCUS13100 [marine metagenome]|uniref:Uncharacterized protein n=1 Tax=marine metagenome TaxID=408172 RepID=A0A381P006_9ZZZZ
MALANRYLSQWLVTVDAKVVSISD